MYLSICKEHSHKLAHYLSHKETLYEDHFSLLSKTLFLSCFCCSSFVVCCECLLMVLFIGEASQSCLTCMKTLVICLSCKNTKCPLQCMHHTMCLLQCIHHNMCYSYTTPCVQHAPCYLSSHATFHFVKCMLAM
jgi:hypothetical protein